MNQKILIISIITLLIDQISKILVGLFMKSGDFYVVIDNFFTLTNITNTGAAFSILEGNTWFLIILSIVIIFILISMRREFKENKLNTFAFGLLFGGICGNFSDRLFLGSVRDFIKIDLFSYNFPVFNLADVFIVVGVMILMISLIKGEDKIESSSTRIRK